MKNYKTRLEIKLFFKWIKQNLKVKIFLGTSSNAVRTRDPPSFRGRALSSRAEMKIVTWNVNSIRQRLDRLADFLERNEPDAVCLQETKVTDEQFPHAEIRKMGYSAVVHGEQGYNGVAILSCTALTDVEKGMQNAEVDSEARVIAATIKGMRLMSVYVPNGQEPGSEKFAFKMKWLETFRSFLEKRYSPDEPLVVLGDFNVAPADIDVHDPGAWKDSIHTTKEERAALGRLMDWGLTDTWRALYPDEAGFTWWDYRRLSFDRNHGLRIDLMLATKPAAEGFAEMAVDRKERAGEGVSDHAPLLALIK